jgi:hypothetical protein
MATGKRIHGSWIAAIFKSVGAERLLLGLGAILCIAATSGFGLTSIASAAYPWSTSLETGSEISFVRVSCSSPTFCMAIGNDQHAGIERSWTFDGSTWSVGPSFTPKAGAPRDISCVSSDFCLVIGDHTWAWTYRSGAWEVSASELNSGVFVEIPDVSCVSETFCAAGGGSLGTGGLWNFDGHTWTLSFPGHGEVEALSCSAPGFCVAGDSDAFLYAFDGVQWGPAVNQGFTRGISGVSCVSATFCLAVDGVGLEASTYGGSGWGKPEAIHPKGTPNRVSCATPTFCVLTDEGGYAMKFDGHSWTVPVQVSAARNGASSISCPSATFCMAVEASTVFAYTGGAWPTEEVVKPPPPPPPPPVVPPTVKITQHPARETPDQTAEFKFTGVAGGSYECLVDGGAWASCRSGDSFGPLQPGDHRFEVREVLKGVTGPSDSYSWTVDLPRACVLKVARARVFAFTHQGKARLVIHYKAYKPARVTVSYSLAGGAGGLALGTASQQFKTAGIFHLVEKLSRSEVAKLRATTSMKVKFSIPQAPSSCARYYTKGLTIPKKVFGQTVWFQSDSIFAGK